MAVPLALGASMALADPDTTSKQPGASRIISTTQLNLAMSEQIADAEATRPKQGLMNARDVILYNIISDQISEMRRKSALPAVMCIAESTGDGNAETVSRALMARLEADNAQVEDSLFTLKPATECQSAGARMVDRETHERAMMIVAGPMESDMKGLMDGCGDYVGGFMRASDDSDFDFYTVNGGDVARKLGCELAQ
ncbi:MAG TPA: hypothetical protein VFE34_07850 [Dongiaceae bacterium]|nr:hypothetical protein [Dongiaceae bacterium]